VRWGECWLKPLVCGTGQSGRPAVMRLYLVPTVVARRSWGARDASGMAPRDREWHLIIHEAGAAI
jgi:hypothetical protein